MTGIPCNHLEIFHLKLSFLKYEKTLKQAWKCEIPNMADQNITVWLATLWDAFLIHNFRENTVNDCLPRNPQNLNLECDAWTDTDRTNCWLGCYYHRAIMLSRVLRRSILVPCWDLQEDAVRKSRVLDLMPIWPEKNIGETIKPNQAAKCTWKWVPEAWKQVPCNHEPWNSKRRNGYSGVFFSLKLL